MSLNRTMPSGQEWQLRAPKDPQGREKLEDVSALTGLQLGEVVLPQEAAGHEHREQKEEAAGSWEKPLLYFQQAKPPASLEWGRHRAQLPWDSARRKKERDPTLTPSIPEVHPDIMEESTGKF